MDIDSLTVTDMMHLIEGYYCFPAENEEIEYLQKTLLGLIEYHETRDDELMAGLNYYGNNIGTRPLLPFYCPETRRDFLSE